MFDFGFTELLVIGVVALVVVGPERMPEVARTAGRWLARAQGYITQIKSEFENETQLSEIKQIREELRSGAAAVRDSVQAVNESLQGQTRQLNQALNLTTADVPAQDEYTEFNRSAQTFPEETQQDEAQARSNAQNFARSNPFGWDMPQESGWESQYIPRRYKATAGLDELVGEVSQLREQMALSGQPLRGNNRRYAVRSRTNRVRIYR